MTTRLTDEHQLIPRNARTCPNCGGRIYWKRTPTGGWIPVDPVNNAEPNGLWNSHTMRAHYDTCQKCVEWRRKKAADGRVRGNAVMRYVGKRSPIQEMQA